MNLETLIIPLKIDKKGFQFDIKALAKDVAIGVGAVAATMAIAVKATMDWANDLDSLQDVMGGTNKQVAALNFVARKSGVGVETLSKGMVILEKGLVKANGQLDVTGKALKTWGINVKDANGHLKDSVQLTDEVAKKYGELGTQQERVNFLTEIFGKNGAQMVDFFDTLNSEGGIAAVTKKVEAFGLAIDPARYEKFNRNLEELKLIGLGLAVQFTEKVMPVLEHFLGWLNKTAQSSQFKEVKDKISGLLDNILGGSKTPQTMFDMKNVDRVAKPDFWKSVGTTIGNAIQAGASAVINPAFWDKLTTPPPGTGDKFASFMEGLTGIGKDVKPGSAQDPIANLVKGWGNSLSTWFAETTARFKNWVSTTSSNIVTWSANTVPIINTWAANTVNTITNKLTDISKAFFNAGGKWINQAVAGFNDHKNALLNAISAIVQEINGILKKIITSFAITIKLPFGLGGTSTPPKPPTGGGGGGVGNKRATGGAVLAGHAYKVNEWKQEMFVPNTSGRVDPMKAEANQPLDLTNRTIRKLVQGLGEANLKAA